MSCEVAAHPFQANANYGTRSIDFGKYSEKKLNKGIMKQNRF